MIKEGILNFDNDFLCLLKIVLLLFKCIQMCGYCCSFQKDLLHIIGDWAAQYIVSTLTSQCHNAGSACSTNSQHSLILHDLV